MARHYGSNTERGYGRAHWALRAHWKPTVEAGLVDCYATVCLEERDGRGKRIKAGTPWVLGHTEDRTGWTGPEHQRCGTSDGARRGNKDRPRRIAAAMVGRTPTCGECGVEYHYSGKQCSMCGRHYHPSRGVQYTCSRACGVALKRLKYGNGSGRTPSPPPVTPARGDRACVECGGTVWRNDANRVDEGWACASCRRRKTVTVMTVTAKTATAGQSRAW